MHMTDAMLSPAIGCTIWAVSAGTIAFSAKKLRTENDDRKVPLMGVMGAFIFAVQMINFAIPATGSSGHLGGGLLLSILLGPCAALLTISSVLTVQALFFADGGLLALGCNILNLGIFPAFIAYPLIYKSIIGTCITRNRLIVASTLSAIVGLQMGAFAVIFETTASGISSLPLTAFIFLMQPIHLGIGIVEGLVTASIVSFIYKARPEIFQNALSVKPVATSQIKTITTIFLVTAVLFGGFVSRYASELPDGLEWSILKLAGKEIQETPTVGIHTLLANWQQTIALFPEYNFKQSSEEQTETSKHMPKKVSNETGTTLGTSISGLLGSFITLSVVALIGVLLKKRELSG